ncbi:MAG: metallophosphoesterase [Acetatifactor sp.]
MINIERYEIDDKLGIRIALVADLHEKNPAEVLIALKKISPDYIMFPGDLWERQKESEAGEWNHSNMSQIQTGSFALKCGYFFTEFISGRMFRKNCIDNRTEEEKNYSNTFLQKAHEIAPVILSVGNHEWYYTDGDYNIIKQTGTTLLDNSDICIKSENRNIVIGGLSTRVDTGWLEKYLSKEADYKILLCHHPEYVKRFVEGKGSVDLILSGHAHGGQWRLFGRIPIYAPGQGLFPKYTKGVYQTSAGRLVVTTGCSNHIWCPRFGNPCEVVELIL